MGTRCQIVVEGSKIKLYRHWDGYPEGVVPALQRIVAEFWLKRGHEPDMFLAYLTEQMRAADSGGEVTGFRLSTEWYGGVEYVYRVLASGALEVREVTEKFDEKPSLRHTKLLQTVALETDNVRKLSERR